uniref:hypothetical protein n=1 Tax=Rickettsia endosymbiont of Urophora cardui TaxID=3066265 RepID=UPI00313EA1CF
MTIFYHFLTDCCITSCLKTILSIRLVEFWRTDSVFKVLYLTIDYITKKWSMPIPNWNEAMAHFMIKFDGRI